jgi:hypothetical protein
MITRKEQVGERSNPVNLAPHCRWAPWPTSVLGFEKISDTLTRRARTTVLGINEAGKAEVDEPHPSAGLDEDVLGLDVGMEDAGSMQLGIGIEYASAQFQHSSVTISGGQGAPRRSKRVDPINPLKRQICPFIRCPSAEHARR